MKPFLSITRHDGTKETEASGAVVAAISLYKCACSGSERQKRIACRSSSRTDMMHRIHVPVIGPAGGRAPGIWMVAAAAGEDRVTVKSGHVASVCGITQ